MKYLVFCFGLMSVVNAQSYNPDAVNKKAAAAYADAIQLLQDEQTQQAIPVLQKAISYDAKYADAYLSLAGAYGELKDYNNAVIIYTICCLIQ